MQVLDEKFYIPYSSWFEEGEFRKRIQFMYGGKLQKVKFKYSGSDIDAVRLPTRRYCRRKMEFIPSVRRCSGKRLICGCEARERR
jgi:hypothetical protein